MFLDMQAVDLVTRTGLFYQMNKLVPPDPLCKPFGIRMIPTEAFLPIVKLSVSQRMQLAQAPRTVSWRPGVAALTWKLVR